MSVLQKRRLRGHARGMPDYGKIARLASPHRDQMDGKTAITSTLESVSSDPVSDSAFAIPSDYTEMKMPDFLNGNKPSDEPAPPDISERCRAALDPGLGLPAPPPIARAMQDSISRFVSRRSRKFCHAN